MTVSAENVGRCIRTLEAAYSALQDVDRDDVAHDVFRAACVKEFEVVLEQSGKLTRRWLRPFFAGTRQVDRLRFKDVFRHAAKHGLVSPECSERWLAYRDARNSTAHEYGEILADETLSLLPQFIADARRLTAALESDASTKEQQP